MSSRPDSAARLEPRCTPRKHVADGRIGICDCGAILVGPTAAGNALVVTILGTTVPVMVRDEADRLRAREGAASVSSSQGETR